MHTHEDISEDVEIAPGLKIRAATVADGASIWRLVSECKVLDTNSCYAYLLIGRDFGETTLVAHIGDELVGFVSAYIPPTRQDVIFVWQIGVASAGRGRGIAKRLLVELVSLPSCRNVRHLEATITPSNTASMKLFRSLAQHLQAEVAVLPGFCSEDFGSAGHESEDLIRIGPIRRKHEDIPTNGI